jgi:alkylation response protein AidB-like acyl-CoA dehydrogenase
MNFGLTAEQRQFGAAVHDLLADSGVPAAARAWADGDHGPGLAIWQALAKAGVTALAVPESSGGLGASPVDLVVACEELGHHPLPGPIAESVAAVPALLAALASPPPQPGPRAAAIATAGDPGCAAGAREWLAGLASGELIATLAIPPALPYALDADVAGLVLLADAGTVWRARSGTGLKSIDPARRLFEVEPDQAVANSATAAASAASHGTLASAALLLGAGRGLLDATVAHAKTREQFGKPIGAFQSVKHKLADVLIGLEFARPLLYAAAVALASDSPTVSRDVSAARVACADAAGRAARTALQVHGAIGYTRECDVSLWLAKVRALSQTWGSQAEHRAAVLAALTEPASGPWR